MRLDPRVVNIRLDRTGRRGPPLALVCLTSSSLKPVTYNPVGTPVSAFIRRY
jgi:hypothetical protein